MNELSHSIAEAIKFRATTSILGTYFLFWLVFHWQAFYVTFFVNEDLILTQHHILKNEYINQYFIQPRPDSISFWVCIIVPGILTYLWIWVLPKLLFIKAFKREREYTYEKRSQVVKDQIRLKKLEEELAKKNVNIADLELDATKKELSAAKNELSKVRSELEVQRVFHATEELTDNEKQYREFMKKDNAHKILDDIKECIYKYSGRLDRPSYNYTLNTDSYVAADTNKLVRRIKGTTYPTIELTDLGRYFLSKL
ncbi:MAG TPA: hypothetical protein VFH06_05160 [Candidatus Saccharimonadales bacterium]|nr:hypothetical protein [Candidatus Saccharimonadales bacterium]